MFNFGFLRSNNIITQYSPTSTKCKQSLIVKDSFEKSKLIRKINDVIYVEDLHHHQTDFHLDSGNIKNLYDHHTYLVNGTDLMEQLDEFMHDSIIDDNSLIDLNSNKMNAKFDDQNTPINVDPFETIRTSFSSGITNFFEIIKLKLFNFFFYIIGVLFIIFIVHIFYVRFNTSSRTKTMLEHV